MQNNNESAIRFSDLIFLFTSKLWLLILVAVIVGGSTFAYNYFTYTPLYESTSSIYILRQGADSDAPDYNSDFSLALSVVNDCTKLMTSRAVLDEVIEDNSLPYSYEQLNSMISVNNPPSTRYLEVTVKSDSPEQSKIIVDSLCEIGKEQIVSLMGFNQVNIVDEGTLALVPCNSRYSYTSVLFSIVAFLLTYIIIMVIYIFDDKLTDADQVEKVLGLSVLALIPDMDNDKNGNNTYNRYYKTSTKRHRYYAKNWKESR